VADGDTPADALQARLTDLAAQIKVEHTEHVRKSREGSAHAIRAGELLLEAKDAVPYREWEDRLQQLCRDAGISVRTARVYMQLAKRVACMSPAKRQRAADLSQRRVLEQIGRKSERNVEHYTSAPIIEAARRVFGGTIDLDPASCREANRVVRATKFFTKDDDGLQHDWHAGRPSAENGFQKLGVKLPLLLRSAPYLPGPLLAFREFPIHELRVRPS
jgi:hypothetical protein